MIDGCHGTNEKGVGIPQEGKIMPGIFLYTESVQFWEHKRDLPIYKTNRSLGTRRQDG